MGFERMPQCLDFKIRTREGSKVQKGFFSSVFILFLCYQNTVLLAEGADIVSSAPEKNLPSLEYVVHVPPKLLRKC